MPRGGWMKAKDVYCDKFRSNIVLQKFMGKAKAVLTSNSGQQLTVREYKLNPTKRHKTEIALKEESSLFESKIHVEALKIFKEKYASLEKIRVENVERTRKISSMKVDYLRLDSTIKAVEAHVRATPPQNMSDVARILQSAQICYQEITSKEFKVSTWRESILKKVSSLEAKNYLLKKVRAFGS
ncbi:hypothetical protein NAPIS_ORF02648 [Vairimorpha apis BRL 01]|uniref:Uncharacterized protein n=1 Tax=Vairimorpha apis BRL 01 TaxID=1037528 RepID=T0MFG2_9MICR|nr:hypothetical protein NAPIS_ORF02648 [Vairimorpha apis BRL 01]